MLLVPVSVATGGAPSTTNETAECECPQYLPTLCVKRLITLFCFITALALSAQDRPYDSLQVSLLTCDAGPDAYERFGHTGIRIRDPKGRLDVVYHYGVFSFHTPFFVYRFVKGETDYRLGRLPMDLFLAEYRERGLGMTEQVLWLTRAERQDLLRRLERNYQPERRMYRYNFFFDNCATRPYRIIEAATGHRIRYDSAAWMRPQTLRQLVAEKACPPVGPAWRRADNWLYFGISLCIAGRADLPTTMEEQLFLPDHLMEAYRHAMIDFPTRAAVADSAGEAPITLTRPLVREERTLLTSSPAVSRQIRSFPLISPLAVGSAFLVLALFTTFLGFRNGKRRSHSRAMVGVADELEPPIPPTLARRAADVLPLVFDSLLLLATGLAGCIVWFLNFFSQHPAVDHNWNCLWLLPTNTIFAALIWLKSLQKIHRIYFFIIFAALIVYLVATALFVDQYVHPAFFPILLALMVRSLAHMGTTATRQTEQ